MRLNILLALTAVAGLTACAQAASPAPKTDEEKALYSLGIASGRDLQGFSLTDQELEMVKAGFTDGIRDAGKLKPEEMNAVLPKLQELYKTRMEASAKKEKEAGAAYLAKAAAEKGATKTASGLVYRETQAGTGASPKPEDVVKVHYEGKFPSGKVFDSSIERKEPASFPLNGVIPCWTEGVGMMKVGGKAQIVCPPELAYGDEGRPPQMPGGATLIFNVELLEIEKPQAAADAAPPAPAR
ncbi:MAG TPA: FKBP-type peptidyl-prolyl cis-trans isomerase [Steroidobacteraceae bacterium]|nr:FKBP-type peptidyl-prolyl cis-trans isomerase [Steroidobacteraceae bacterium]